MWVHTPQAGHPKGRVLIIHGLSEHSGRHLNTVNHLQASGWEVGRFDLRGAGQSGGKRQWIESFEQYVDDATTVFNWLMGSREPLPTFILGHSLGGAIATHFAARYSKELTGLVLSAPAYRVGSTFPPWMIALGKAACTMVPTLRLPSATGEWISRDPKVVEAYINDPLACRANTLRQGREILRGLDHIPEKCSQIHCPVLIVHGSSDRVIRPEGSLEMLQMIGSTDKILHFLPGGYHEPHNDLDKDHYFELLTQWLDSHLPTPR